MRTIDRRLEKIEKVAVVREPETWLLLIEPEADASKAEWDAYLARVSKIEADGNNLINIRVI